MNVGVLGYGYWGPNLVRNFMQKEGITVFGLADLREDRLKIANKSFRGILLTREANDLLTHPEIDAIVIATPASTHYAFAKKAIENGKHVLVEKPLATKNEEVADLFALAEKHGVKLMVDYTFLYTGSVQKIKKTLQNQDFGQIHYIDSTRINLGVFQYDTNVLWDLATHDLSIIYHLIDERPYQVQAIGAAHMGNGVENIAYVTLRYRSGLVVHLNCSWASPVKIRKMIIGGDKKMIIYDDIEPTDKLKIYDYGYSMITDEYRRNALVDYRLGDVSIPKFSLQEALAGLVDDFYNVVVNNGTPLCSPQLSIDVTRTLIAAEQSLKQDGQMVAL
jgi:predicted dehydrogenase